MHRWDFARPLFAFVIAMSATTGLAALQLHLPFDETTGLTVFNDGATDSVNNGTLDTANGRAAGKVGGGAVSFDGSAASTFTAGTNLNVTPDATLRTISAWINTSGGAGQDTAISFGFNNNPASGTSDPGTKFEIDIDNATGAIEVGVGGGRMVSPDSSMLPTPAVNDGNWHLATIVIPDILDDDPAAMDISDIDIYVNGIFSYDGSANNAADRTISTGGVDGGGSVFIGRSANGDASQPFVGLLDDIAVWDSPITPDEIKGLFDVGDQLGVNASAFDQVLALHGAGAGSISAGDYEWTFASGLTGTAGISGTSLVLDDAANTGVTFSALVPGDVNNNGVADQDDFDIILSNFKSSVVSRSDGDLNADGVVDFFDFRLWKDASGSSIAIPEPGSIVLLAGAGLLAFGLRRRPTAVALLVAVAFGGVATQDASAQSVTYYFLPADGDFDADASWDSGFRPEAALDEIGAIGSTDDDAVFVGAPAVAVARLDSTALSPGSLTLGLGAEASGTLIVESGGSLTVSSTATVDGGLFVGVGANAAATAGRGFLDVSGNGSVTAVSVGLNGSADPNFEESEWSRISLSDSASLTTTAGSMAFNRVFEVTGPNVTVSSADELNFGARGRYIANVTGASHPILSAVNNIVIDGLDGDGAQLQINLSGGATLGAGDSLTLFDSGGIDGTFGSVLIDGVAPAKGQAFSIDSVPGGVNGLVTSLNVTNELVLEVNRDTGIVSIQQPFGSPIPIDGYSINSSSGSLGAADWDSLEDQSVSDWIEANGQPTAISELKPTGSTAVVGAGFELGSIYTPDRSVFGAGVPEDLVFEYVDTSGALRTGQVFYSGVAINDLVLIVDPSTGEAQLRNTSSAPVSIDGYQISSESGALLTSGWESLEDQSVSDWAEAFGDSFSLIELLPSGVETLAGDTGYNLGALFDTSGLQDLSIEYFDAGENVLQFGQVLYDVLPDIGGGFLEADFNMDGNVDLLDLDILGSNFGMPGMPSTGDANGDGNVDLLDLDILGSQFGQSQSSVAIPEPGAGLLALLTAAIGSLLRRPRRAVALVTQPHTERPRMSAGFHAAIRLSSIAAVFGVVASAPAQTILFNADFASGSAGPVTDASDLGSPIGGTFGFGDNAMGAVGGTDQAFVTAQTTGSPALTQMQVNNVTYGDVFPETQVVDAGGGDTLIANFGSPGLFTSGDKTELSFDWGIYGTSNTGDFKYQFVRGLDASDNEVFELLLIAGSGNATRQLYARGPNDDSTELTAANSSNPEGTLLASGFTSAINSTNPANAPGAYVTVDVLLEDGLATFDIGATNDTFTSAPENGTSFAINSAATSIEKLEFSSIWHSTVDGQNKGYWLDDIFAITTPETVFAPGDVNGDGSVDLDDFNIIAANFKSSVVSRGEGDLNADGFVDFDDFREWKDASSASTSIPEPTALVLAGLTLAGFARRRR